MSMANWIGHHLTLMVVGAILWRLGGSDEAPKAMRRYVLPIVFTIIAYTVTKNIASLILLLTVGAYSIGYGEKHSWIEKILAVFLWMLPSYILTYFFKFNFTYFQIITPLAFLFFFYMSNEHGTATIWRWHYVEIMTGALQGLTIARLLL